MSFLQYEFMQRALIAGIFVGLAAPAIGVYIVQRRLSLLGDGIGHVAFTGVAAGLVVGFSPIATALLFALGGAAVIEVLRERGRAASDVALAVIFYGGIAGAVLLLSLGGISTVNLNSYLFGSVVTVSGSDVWLVAGVAVLVIAFTFALRKQLFAVAYDEEVARVSGLPVRTLNLAIALTSAIAIAISARVVGVLLVSSLLVLPVAAVQQVTRSFRSTVVSGLILGATLSALGLIVAYYVDVAPAATIVLSSIMAFGLASLFRDRKTIR